MLNFSCKKRCIKLCYLGNVGVLLVELCHCKTAILLNLNLLLQPSNALGHVTSCSTNTSCSTVMGTFNSNSGERLNTCWSFISLECEVETPLSWITKIKPKPMMEVSLVLFVRQIHDGQKMLFSDSKIPSVKNLEREELIFGDNGIVSMTNFCSLAEKQKHCLQETLILMEFEIKLLAATEVPFSPSMANCSI